MFTDGVDSYYSYVKGRILAFNPQRTIKGMLSAQDWPYKNVVPDAFYLLVLGEVPIGKQGYSASTPIKFHQVQWVWLNQGTDLVQGIQRANRGDKYRTMQLMKGELTNGHYPGFCQKLTYSLVNGVWTGVSENPVEYITWTPPDFHEKWSAPGGAGVGYGSGACRIADMLDTITV